MYQQQIRRGISYLVSVQNADGGIPATNARGMSGCWTSAETLETVLGEIT